MSGQWGGEKIISIRRRDRPKKGCALMERVAGNLDRRGDLESQVPNGSEKEASAGGKGITDHPKDGPTTAKGIRKLNSP